MTEHPEGIHLLFIEPEQHPTSDPALDGITRKMCAAFRKDKLSDYAYGGVHTCICGANSSCCDHFLPDGSVTNSLCIHYVTHHRASVPTQDLERISAFQWGEAEPTEDELKGPKQLAIVYRSMIEKSLGQAATEA